jgi:hypothetical protein
MRHDSPVEEGRFEPSVPLAKVSLCGGTGNAVWRKKQATSVSVLRGTEGSNLPSSSGESAANLIFAGESHRTCVTGQAKDEVKILESKPTLETVFHSG